MRMNVAICLVLLMSCNVATAQIVDKPVPAAVKPEPPAQESIRVFHLKNASSSEALKALKSIGPPCQLAEDRRMNAIIVRALDRTIAEIASLLQTIDVAGNDTDSTEIFDTHSKDFEAGSAIVEKYAESAGVDLAFDKSLGLFMIKGPKAEVERARAFIDKIRVTSEKNKAEVSQSRPCTVRVLWLSNDPSEDSNSSVELDAPLKKVVQKLGELGYSNMKVKMQLLGRSDIVNGQAESQVEGSHESGTSKRTLNLRARLTIARTSAINGKITLEAAVLSSNTAPANIKADVAIQFEPKKYYVLSAGPLGTFQTAFVVQLIEDF